MSKHPRYRYHHHHHRVLPTWPQHTEWKNYSDFTLNIIHHAIQTTHSTSSIMPFKQHTQHHSSCHSNNTLNIIHHAIQTTHSTSSIMPFKQHTQHHSSCHSNNTLNIIHHAIQTTHSTSFIMPIKQHTQHHSSCHSNNTLNIIHHAIQTTHSTSSIMPFKQHTQHHSSCHSNNSWITKLSPHHFESSSGNRLRFRICKVISPRERSDIFAVWFQKQHHNKLGNFFSKNLVFTITRCSPERVCMALMHIVSHPQTANQLAPIIVWKFFCSFLQ